MTGYNLSGKRKELFVDVLKHFKKWKGTDKEKLERYFMCVEEQDKEFIQRLEEEIKEIMKECGGTGADLESPEVENYMPAAIIKRLKNLAGKELANHSPSYLHNSEDTPEGAPAIKERTSSGTNDNSFSVNRNNTPEAGFSPKGISIKSSGTNDSQSGSKLKQRQSHEDTPEESIKSGIESSETKPATSGTNDKKGCGKYKKLIPPKYATESYGFCGTDGICKSCQDNSTEQKQKNGTVNETVKKPTCINCGLHKEYHPTHLCKKFQEEK